MSNYPLEIPEENPDEILSEPQLDPIEREESSADDIDLDSGSISDILTDYNINVDEV